MNNKLILLFLFVLCFSCDKENRSTEKSIIGSKNTISEKLKWDKITVMFLNVSYSIKYNSDSLDAKRWNTIDSVVDGSVYKTDINIRKRRFFINANLNKTAIFILLSLLKSII